MKRFKLDPAQRKSIEDLQADLDDLDEALAAFREADLPMEGLESEVEKLKKQREVLLKRFG